MFTLDQAIINSRRRINNSRRWALYGEMNHGKKILQSDEELEAYMSLYGEMHQFKCKAAMQSFPFEKLGFEIQLVDWGCGQGLATLCFLEALDNRGKLGIVRKITLIEPSVTALKRAVDNIKQATSGLSVEIETLNAKLPSKDEAYSPIESIKLNKGTTIHFFSNILDVLDINLKKTAQIVESGRGDHFVLCMGPRDINNKRIDEFCEYFSPRNDFAIIEDGNIGYTSDTRRATSCKIRCFWFASEKAHVNDKVTEGHYDESGAYDDYDYGKLIQHNILNWPLVNIYQKISAKCYVEDRIYLRPDIGGESPDLLIMRKDKGLVVLNVFDEDLSQCRFDDDEFFCNGQPSMSPQSAVISICDRILNEKSAQMLQNALNEPSGWYAIRPAVWFPRASTQQIKSLFNSGDGAEDEMVNNRVLLLAGDAFDVKDVWTALDLNHNRRSFTRSVHEELITILKSKWHTYKEGDSSIKLEGSQRDLAISMPSKRQKISGVAGSGKTQVLASRAINCYLRTGKSVLVLTFNTTLANYIRYRIGRIPADFLWEKIYITTYHRFFGSQAKRVRAKSIVGDMEVYSDLNFFRGYENQVSKFSAILVDEAQDYEYNWLKILQDYFLEPNGEFVIFGDVKQNIYRRELDEHKEIHTPIPGRWITRLNIGYRFDNQQIGLLSMEYQKHFFKDIPTDAIQLSLGFSDGRITYDLLNSQAPAIDIAGKCLKIVEENALSLRDTIIISQTNKFLRAVEKAYRDCRPGESPMITFETQEQYERLEANSKNLKMDLWRIRDHQKAHFTMMTDQIKMSSIYSYKGWEADNVILLIQPEKEYIKVEDSVMAMPELVYTAITRAKKNLFILNIGNSMFDDFFVNTESISHSPEDSLPF